MIYDKLIQSYEHKIRALESRNKELEAESKKNEKNLRDLLDLTYLYFKDCPREWFENKFRYINARLLMDSIRRELEENKEAK